MSIVHPRAHAITALCWYLDATDLFAGSLVDAIECRIVADSVKRLVRWNLERNLTRVRVVSRDRAVRWLEVGQAVGQAQWASVGAVRILREGRTSSPGLRPSDRL